MRMRLFLAAGSLFCSVTVAQAMYCGTNLVREGQSKYDVLRICGQPAFMDGRIEFRPVSGNVGPLAPGQWNIQQPGNYPQPGHYPQTVIFPVEIDEWVYNFGPTQLMPSLLFENGRIVRIQLLGYGN